MTAPVPLYAVPDWREKPGTELASVSGESPEEVEAAIGLAPNRNGRLVHPRVELLKLGKLNIEDLDDEELQRGQLRDTDGKFRGGPLRRIPKEFHDELMRRILARGTDKLRGNYMAAVDTLVDIMNDETVDAPVRVNVAKYVIERLAGKTPERVEVAATVKPWQVAMQTIIREVPEDALEVEVVEDEDDED